MIRDSFQKVCNACHLKWDKTSPPILNEPRLDDDGLQQISSTQLKPYDLFHQSLYLSNNIFFAELQRFVIALWRDKFTTDRMLCAELLEQQQSNLMTRKDIINHLTWCIQQTPPRFQGSWISVKSCIFIFTYFY